MNAAQQLGKGAGAAVAAGDVGKAAVAGWVGRWLAGAAGANAAASAAVIGHCFPPGRKGGKGVAASIGQVVATFPVYLPIDIAVGAAATMLPGARHRTRMATMVASSVWVASAALWWRRRWPNPGAEPASISLGVGALVSSAAIAVRFYAEADQVEAAVSEQRSEEG
jgi:glycerol-3-phosphate acyltransferase PlsY